MKTGPAKAGTPCAATPHSAFRAPRFVVRLNGSYALKFHPRGYWTEEDGRADHFASAQAAHDCAREHLMRPDQFTVEELTTKNAERAKV